MSDPVAADLLQSLVRRIESVEDEINALNSDKSEIYKEAKGAGFDVKVMRKLIADRRKDTGERVEFETIYDLYAQALGMYSAPAERLVRAHVEIIEEFPAHDADGVILEDELPPASRGYVGEDDLREPAATVRGQITQEGDAPREAIVKVIGEGLAGHAAHLSTEFTPETANEAETACAPVEPCNNQHGDGNGLRLKGNATNCPEGSVGSRESGSLADHSGITQCGDDAPPAPSLTSPTPKFDARSLRPHCKQPYACGGSGRQHCWKCKVAAGLEAA